ncbi:hypothetical protein H7H78_01190 [Mycobacterium shinjukuense]|nr:hypothetical protein [Mycobacterium shinjukuense]MCV6984115.1 hypothetical protein [Mycobacterium shinjukuense]
MAVLSGMWKSCGLIRNVGASLQLTSMERDAIGVDNNLCGVSGQVTKPGVLDFPDVFTG